MVLKSVLEVLSDVLGAISAIALLIPAHNIAAAKATISRTADSVAEATIPEEQKQLLQAIISRAEEASNAFNPSETLYFKVGGWTLLASFLLKLAYHWLDKM